MLSPLTIPQTDPNSTNLTDSFNDEDKPTELIQQDL